MVRPVSGSQRNGSVSAFSKLSSMLSRLRCDAVVLRVEHGVGRDLARERVGGVRARARSRLDLALLHAIGAAANVRPGSCSSMLNTVCSEAIGRSSIDSMPSSTQPIAGPSATPSSRTLPSCCRSSSTSQSRRRGSARCAGCAAGTGRCDRCRAGAARLRTAARIDSGRQSCGRSDWPGNLRSAVMS